MKKFAILALFLLLVTACFARTPTEEECQKEIQTALKNIEAGKKPLAAADYMSAGTCYDNRKEYNTSLDCFMKAAELRVETNDDAGASADYEAVAGTYRDLGDEENAMKYYKIALDYSFKAGLPALLNAGTYKKMGDYENACKYCRMNESYDYCKEYRYCKDSSSSAGGPVSSPDSNSFGIYIIPAAAIILILIAGLFLSKKKK